MSGTRPPTYNCREHVPACFNCREHVPSTYNCREHVLDSYKWRERFAHALEQIARAQTARKTSKEGSQMFSKNKKSKMAVFKDNNNNAVEDVSTTFLF